MKYSTSYEYGTCPCGGKYKTRQVEVRTTIGSKLVILNEVPQGACPQCGSRVYKAEVLARVETFLIRSSSEGAGP